MSVWLTIPSARPPAEVEPVLSKWRRMGYKIALWRDTPGVGDKSMVALYADNESQFIRCGPYPGYAKAVNALVTEVMRVDSTAEWMIAAGDDTLPDPSKKAEEIAVECRTYFRSIHATLGTPPRAPDYQSWGTFGCMQPTGDTWRDVQGRIIERIAGSAWLGREFCTRINQGKGPLWPEYTHCFVDEELQCVAQKYGVFWQRPDLIHHHEHWARKNGDVRDMPAHLTEANSAAHWDKYKGIFTARKAAGFPGSEPL